MCDLIYRGGILKTKPGKKDSAVDAILADKEFAMDFAGCDFDAIMEEIGFYVIDKKDWSPELKYHAYPEDVFYALDKVLFAISPFIQQGSYLEFSDNKGNLRRYIFNGEEMRRVEPQIIWPAITAEQYAAV